MTFSIATRTAPRRRVRKRRRVTAALVGLAAAATAALGGAGSALAAGDAALPRVGYCMDGKFLNLELGQPKLDPMYEDAVLAWYIDGRGITCAAPPPGWVAFETAPDEFGVPGRLYAYWVPPAAS